MYAQGKPLNAKSMEKEDITLITAARRRFPSWDRTLVAAGLNYRDIVLRAPFTRRRKTSTRTRSSSGGDTQPRSKVGTTQTSFRL